MRKFNEIEFICGLAFPFRPANLPLPPLLRLRSFPYFPTFGNFFPQVRQIYPLGAIKISRRCTAKRSFSRHFTVPYIYNIGVYREKSPSVLLDIMPSSRQDKRPPGPHGAEIPFPLYPESRNAPANRKKMPRSSRPPPSAQKCQKSPFSMFCNI